MNSLSFLSTYNGLRIICAPLNWGLGHATRMIPIIDILCERNTVILAGDGDSIALLHREFPSLESITLPSYGVRYNSESIVTGLLLQSPRLVSAISQEMSIIDDYVKEHNIDWVISDHRLGARSDHCRSTIVAHQLQLKASSWLSAKIGTKTNQYFINQFDECWVPDYERRDMSLAGDLSLVSGINQHKYIGPLSRMKPSTRKSKTYDITVVLSGPEPARTQTERILVDLLSRSDLQVHFVRGVSDSLPDYMDHCSVDNLCDTKELNTIYQKSEIIISRSGYSTIMDLELMQKKAILIPTPGQTEQEYLAQHLANRSRYQFLSQKEITMESLSKALSKLTQ